MRAGRALWWFRARPDLTSLTNFPHLSEDLEYCTSPASKCNRIMPGAGQLIRHVSEIYIAGKVPTPRLALQAARTPSCNHTSSSPSARDDNPTLMHSTLNRVSGRPWLLPSFLHLFWSRNCVSPFRIRIGHLTSPRRSGERTFTALPGSPRRINATRLSAVSYPILHLYEQGRRAGSASFVIIRPQC